MKFKHEIIKTNDNLPVKLFCFKADNFDRIIPKHWHKSMELIYCLFGKLNVWVNSEKFVLNKGDCIFINSNEIHQTCSPERNQVIVLQIPHAFIRNYLNEYDGRRINLNTLIHNKEKEEYYNEIRKLLKEMYDAYEKQGEAYSLRVYSLLFQLEYILVSYFIEDKQSKKFKSEKYLERLNMIVEYINENYNLEISLEKLAKEFNLTSEYLSRFFKKYTGITFLNYLNSVRLDFAYKEVMNTDYSITEIALNNGFPNTKSFNMCFRKIYGMNPKEYRSVKIKK